MKLRLVLLFTISCKLGNAQAQEDIVLKAMQDELTRNMAELQAPGKEKPCYIAYGVLDKRTQSVAATMGSILYSEENRNRARSTSRVLVGSLEFNDESLEDNLFSSPSLRDLDVPVEDDYFGIRRSFWSITDNVYREAARHYEKHKETLKETGKQLAELPHRSFGQAKSIKLINSTDLKPFDRTAWENMARNLSAISIRFPGVMNSSVVFTLEEGHDYFVSSEGTLVKVPFSLALFTASIQGKNEKGEMSIGQVKYVVRNPAQLPDEQKLAREFEELHTRLSKQLDAPSLDQDYEGPVLIMGQAVAHTLTGLLLNGREGLLASDNIPRLTGFQFGDDAMGMDNKIGKSVVNESITVKAKPKLKTFQGTELLGSFEVDPEGVMPPDELTLVEKGILKNLLNNRTITQTSQTANGFGSGPGVMEVTVSKKDTDKALKEKLIAEAKKQGLEYGMIARGAGFGLMDIFKVYVADGREEYVRNAILAPTSLKALRHLLGASDKYQAYNLSETNGFSDFGLAGGPSGRTEIISAIVPESILVESMDVRAYQMPYFKEEEFVKSPLK